MEQIERALLVFTPMDGDLTSLEIKIDELHELADTAGLIVVDEVVQRRRGNRRLIGSGKTEEIASRVVAEEVDVVIFDGNLSPSETRFLEDAIDCKVIDRSALILDIFAQRASSREGKLQVEMAQLSWLLPRLIGKGKSLSRLGGGVGTRGPGETKLETDRRHIRRRLNHVKAELAKVVAQRKLQRAARRKLPDPYVVIIGYTNAGKSSLLNRLCGSDIYVADQLFATLDPTTRRLELASGTPLFISDTVGFIRDLPPHLTVAFKATLEILKEADFLLHVVDISEPGYEERVTVVDRFLRELDAAEIPRLYVCNKVDLLPEPPVLDPVIAAQKHVYASAVAEAGIDDLLRALEEMIISRRYNERICLPNDDNGGRLLALAHAYGEVSELTYDESSIGFRLTGDAALLKDKFDSYVE